MELAEEEEAAFTWFVQNRRKAAIALDQDDLVSLDSGIVGVKHKVDKYGQTKSQFRLIVPQTVTARDTCAL